MATAQFVVFCLGKEDYAIPMEQVEVLSQDNTLVG